MTVLLDKTSGKPVTPGPLLSARGIPHVMEDNYERGWRGGHLSDQVSTKSLFDSLPDHVLEMLDKSSGKTGPFAGLRPPTADSSNYEVLRYWISTDTALTAASEAIMVPAFNFYNSEMSFPGKSLRFVLVGSQSANATPGTFTYRMRWGGVAGSIQAASAAITPSNSATATTVSFVLEYWLQVRSTGSAGTMWCQGNLQCPAWLLAAATSTQVVTYLNNCQIPATAAAAGAATDFTVAGGPSPTYQPSASTANCTTHMAFLECLN